MKLITKAILTAALLLPMGVQAKKPNVLDVSRSITDEAIIYPESFEIDTRKLLESWYMKNYTATDDRYRTMPDAEVSDDVIIRRLQGMHTIIEMPFNQIVRAYIDRYTKKGRAQVAAMLGLSNYYMPIFEQALERRKMPLELKYLPIIESALDPNAVSRAGATGLWQFMLASARGLDMQVNSLVDERRDPYISSEKAAKYLQDLYSIYGDWSLAIAAYNCGPGTLNKAIIRAGGDPKSHNFWTIYKYLPAETRGYVPMFIAANYVMTYYKDHNISPVLATKPLVTDTVAVNSRIHFNQISKVLNIPVEELRLLNPQFRADIIPGSVERPYYLILPSQQIHAYIMSEDDIRNYEASRYARPSVMEPGGEPVEAVNAGEEVAVANLPGELPGQEVAAAEPEPQQPAAPPTGRKIRHKVSADESLASIAARYNVRPEDIKAWNKLRRNAVRPGRELDIYVGADYVAAAEPRPATQPRPKRESVAPATPTAQPAAPATPARQRTQPAQPKPKADVAQPKPEPKPKAKAEPKKPKKNVNERTQEPKPKKKDRKRAEPKPVNHDVKAGESLDRIARQHGVTVEELKEANGLNGKNPVLQPGQKLKVPKKGAGKKAAAEEPKGKRGKKAAAEEPKGKRGKAAAEEPKGKRGKKAAAEEPKGKRGKKAAAEEPKKKKKKRR